MYLNPEKLASGAYCCPQSVQVEGFFEISDELTAVMVANLGFVTITVSGNVVTAVKPDTAALAAWEAYIASIHQPCVPYSPCTGHGNIVTACPECKTPLISDVPISEVGRIVTGTYKGVARIKISSSSYAVVGSTKDYPASLALPAGTKFVIITGNNMFAYLYPSEAYGNDHAFSGAFSASGFAGLGSGACQYNCWKTDDGFVKWYMTSKTYSGDIDTNVLCMNADAADYRYIAFC